MEISMADQIALDDALVAPANRLKIGKCNLRLSSDVISKEATLQVVYDVLKLTPFYKAFQVSADVPEIYMQEFWASTYIHNRSVRFKMNNKKHILNLDQFRDILQICPKVGNKKFEEPPLEKEILAFLASLGHSGEIRKITDVNVNKLHQPWRSFAVIINKCSDGKNIQNDMSRLFSSSILWGMYNNKTLIMHIFLWEDFIFQIENKKTKKAIRFLELTNEEIRNSESYKEYYAIASGKIPPKTKASKKKADSDAPTKQKSPTVPKEKKGKKTGKGKQKAKELETISEATLTEAEQLKIITKRSPGDDELKSQDDQDNDDEAQTESEDDGDDFIHLKLTTHDDEIHMKRKTDDDADVVLPQVQVTQEIEDTHVTLTLVNPDGQQQSSSVSSGFEAKTSHAVAANLSELELKKILIDKMEANKSINRSDIQRPQDGADDDQEPSAGTDRGSKRKKSEKKPESTSSFKRKDNTTAGKTTTGSKTHKQSASQSALVEETMQSTEFFEARAHQEFETEGDFHRLRIQDIEDMLLLLVQGKVLYPQAYEDLQLGVDSYQKKRNHRKPDTGFIYENKDKKNRLMRIDELHKFSDGTLDDVRTALNDRLKGIRMEYLPQTFWSQRDKVNARAMIQAIDKRLKTRRIMRSLERFVGGRPYGGDLRLLQRTI
ncbi:hypothetical protein Tco_0726341 [Tanacetum coccineum]|uniref:Uncharacterized protein n=1 Tax=Tanacetum coccineum TaxID=301880 RepID=A0ABQ4YG62_9ASTR